MTPSEILAAPTSTQEPCEAGFFVICGRPDTTKCECCGLWLCAKHSRPETPAGAQHRKDTMTTRNWMRMHRDRGGHTIFTRPDEDYVSGDVPRMWVCDQSGRNPDLADDGPLELVRPEEVVLEPSAAGPWLLARMEVTTASGASSTVLLSAGCAVYVVGQWDVPLRIRAPHVSALLCVEEASRG